MRAKQNVAHEPQAKPKEKKLMCIASLAGYFDRSQPTTNNSGCCIQFIVYVRYTFQRRYHRGFSEWNHCLKELRRGLCLLKIFSGILHRSSSFFSQFVPIVFISSRILVSFPFDYHYLFYVLKLNKANVLSTSST